MATLTPNRPDEEMEILILPEREASEPLAPASSSASGLKMLYILLLVPGVLVTLIAMSLFPLVNPRPALALLLGLFLIPSAMYLASIVRPRPGVNPKRGLAVLITASCALILMGGVFWLNGAKDRAPAHMARSRVVRKGVTYVQRGTRYDVVISPGLTGKSVEDLNVTPAIYHRAAVGSDIAVEVHGGFFGMPWRGKISPE